jgi:RNA polymerase sigma-70 factor (ECF subfamily)
MRRMWRRRYFCGCIGTVWISRTRRRSARGLYRVTVYLCVDRSRRVRPTTELPELGSENPSVEAEVLREERKKLLMIALGTLPAKERAAVVLREIEGLATAEVAEILGSSEVTVRGQVSKAMARLRTLMNKERG